MESVQARAADNSFRISTKRGIIIDASRSFYNQATSDFTLIPVERESIASLLRAFVIYPWLVLSRKKYWIPLTGLQPAHREMKRKTLDSFLDWIHFCLDPRSGRGQASRTSVGNDRGENENDRTCIVFTSYTTSSDSTSPRPSLQRRGKPPHSSPRIESGAGSLPRKRELWAEEILTQVL